MWFVLLVTGAFMQNVYSNLPYPCSSDIYCHGPLLHTVQLAKIFNDSKTFVDLKMRNNRSVTIQNFEQLIYETNNNPTRSDVKKFVLENFEDGDELEKWEPNDYNPSPNFLNDVYDDNVKELAENLIKLWPVLARKVKPEVIKDSSLYSFLPVSNGFVVPGGRFREYYYWDSYWIIKGLLISEMGETARGMIDNFLHIVKTHGFLPNGGRIYYTDRSQPPLLTKMAYEYYKYRGDKLWLLNSLLYLDIELNFWLDNKTMQIKKDEKTYRMAHYKASSTGPRPESYLEDFKTVQIFNELERQEQLYVDIKTAAESGWDFSSRWIFDDLGGNVANLSNIQTRRVIPVDLNAILCEAFKTISQLYAEVGNNVRSDHWKKVANDWEESIKNVLWDSEDGIWYDYDVKLSKPRKSFYVSNISPLWCGCFDKKDSDELAVSAIKYLTKVGATDTAGGVPTSLLQTGEQWDLPNAWPPLQAIVVQGLERTGNVKAVSVAKSLAEKWIHANLAGFNESGEMFEKYDAIQPGKYGGGGEYTVQSGFGWTNGIVLEFIKQYFVKNNTNNVL